MPFVQRTMLRWWVAVALASVLAAGSAPATGLAGVPSSQPMQSDGTGSSVSNAAALKQKMEEGLRDLARRTREVHDIENTLSRMARGQLGPASNMSYIEPDGGVVEQTLSGTNSSRFVRVGAELKTADSATALATQGDPDGGSGPADWNSQSEVPDTEAIRMVPFDKNIPREPGIQYIVADGSQECLLCNMLVAESFLMGSRYPNLCGWQLRDSVNAPMCHAMQRVLQSCPEFVNDWCYQDSGGTEYLRIPCPFWLKCHYCLGMNPMHCLFGLTEFFEGED